MPEMKTNPALAYIDRRIAKLREEISLNEHGYGYVCDNGMLREIISELTAVRKIIVRNGGAT